MKYTTTIILLLTTILVCGQNKLIDQQEHKKQEIEKLIMNDHVSLIVFVKVFGKPELQRVVNENWPENIETTFNIFEKKNGQVIYVAEFPKSESGDWTLELKHYFSDNGDLIAFEKRLSYFNDNCGNGIVVENQIELFDNQFRVIKTTKTFTDGKGKELTETECGNSHNWNIIKRATVKELIDLKKIRLGN